MIGVGIEAAGLSGHEACSDVGAARSAAQLCAMIEVAEDSARETLRAFDALRFRSRREKNAPKCKRPAAESAGRRTVTMTFLSAGRCTRSRAISRTAKMT